ncbi:MAG: Hsp70 family protein [Acidimicrobiales bacterium]
MAINDLSEGNMGYQLGIDLGTTYTAAAVFRDGDSRIFPLGGRSASMPSVVHLREDETVLTGEAAVRRAITEPDRVAGVQASTGRLGAHHRWW